MQVVVFDIETASAAELFTFGPDFIRLCGWKTVGSSDPVTISTDPRELIAALVAADRITGHNIIQYDLLALARWYGDQDQYEALCAKAIDTIIVERHLVPVAAKGAQPQGFYGLDATATRYGVAGKSTVDFDGKRDIVRRIKGDAAADRMKQGVTASFPVLKVLAELYGGYHLIPQDDPDYVAYLRLDVLASEALYLAHSERIRHESMDSKRYLMREHQTDTVLKSSITLTGVRIDVDENMKRWAEGQQRLEDHKQQLHADHGMPLDGKYPHRKNEGKAAFRAALLATGINEGMLDANWPMAKDGSLKTGKDVLEPMIALFDVTKPAAADLCRTILAMNGERSVYGTILQHTVGDRVHPYVGPDQSSGRWSVKYPGLTVLGKRGGKARERGVLLADTDDEVLVAIDADQVDARVVAAECQDPEYMKLFQPGVDLHSEVALRVFGRDECRQEMARNNGRCDCVYRDRAKVFGHGFSYGLGANSMANQHGVDVEVAKRFIWGMTEAFPRLAEWKGEVRAAAGALGFDEEAPANDTYRILHTWAGRPVRVERARAYTQACAQLGQGGTRDVMAQAILNLPVSVRRRVRVVIHDEIVLSLPRAGAQEAAQRIADSMAFDLRGVRITFGCSKVADCLAGCYGTNYCDHPGCKALAA